MKKFNKLFNKSFKIILFSFLLASSSMLSISASESSSVELNDRVLFVGNSFSYFNNGIQNHVSNIARAANKWRAGKSRFRLMTISGGRLSEHQAGLKSALKEERWDKVILQAHSSEPITKSRKKEFIRSTQLLAKMIRKTGAEPVLFMSWAYKGRPEMTNSLKNSFMAMATAINSQVVPVGLAFEKAQLNFPEIELYTKDIKSFDSDGSSTFKEDIKHPSLAGTYLAANVLFGFLYQQSSVGLPYTAGLSAEDAAKLQAVAWQVVTSEQQ
ncbi:MAG: hypothetical protein KUG78_03670 [Kangiellaceae bacterium]|nr:hypothetical protein [Kangiellaceae bacterium]